MALMLLEIRPVGALADRLDRELRYLMGFREPSFEKSLTGAAAAPFAILARTRFPDPQLLMAESQPSSVRLVLSTTAEWVEAVTHPARVVYLGGDRPRGHLDLLLVDGELVYSDELAGVRTPRWVLR